MGGGSRSVGVRIGRAAAPHMQKGLPKPPHCPNKRDIVRNTSGAKIIVLGKQTSFGRATTEMELCPS